MTVLRLQKHVNERGECRLEIWSRNIDNCLWCTEFSSDTDMMSRIMECRKKVVEILADLHNMLSNELRIV